MARCIHPIGTLKPSWRAHYARFVVRPGVPMPGTEAALPSHVFTDRLGEAPAGTVHNN